MTRRQATLPGQVPPKSPATSIGTLSFVCSTKFHFYFLFFLYKHFIRYDKQGDWEQEIHPSPLLGAGPPWWAGRQSPVTIPSWSAQQVAIAVEIAANHFTPLAAPIEQYL